MFKSSLFKSLLFSVIAVGILVTSVFANPVDEGWKKVKDADGIQIYTRPVKDLPMDEFMGVGKINAPVTVATEVFRDFPSFVQWFGDCKEFRTLKAYDNEKDKYMIYFIYQTPSWALGVQNRDCIIDAKADDRSNTDGVSSFKTIALSGNFVPVSSSMVRMPFFECSAKLTKVSDNVTSIEYRVKAHPGGMLPGKLVQYIIVAQPFKTIQGLQRQVNKEIYWQKAHQRYPEVNLKR
jgi:hypothetical protein